MHQLKEEKKTLKNALQGVDGRIKKTPRDVENKLDYKRVKTLYLNLYKIVKPNR